MLAKAILILLVITLSTPWASAQSTFGDVVGAVKDQNQGGVPGAQIVLTSVDDGSQHQTTSDADGAFHFVNLNAGNYNLVAAAAGFADSKISSAHLDARQTLRFDVKSCDGQYVRYQRFQSYSFRPRRKLRRRYFGRAGYQHRRRRAGQEAAGY
jgi:hypothetical protein